MATRKQFTFYRSFFEAIQMLPKASDRAAIYDAVAGYALDGTEAELKGNASIIFALIKPTLDSALRKAENGRSGRPKMAIEKNRNETEINRSVNKGEKEIEVEIEKEVEIEVETEIEKEKESYITLPQGSPLTAVRNDEVWWANE